MSSGQKPEKTKRVRQHREETSHVEAEGQAWEWAIRARLVGNRVAAGLTRSAVAEKIGWSAAELAAIEDGSEAVLIRDIALLAWAYGVPRDLMVVGYHDTYGTIAANTARLFSGLQSEKATVEPAKTDEAHDPEPVG